MNMRIWKTLQRKLQLIAGAVTVALLLSGCGSSTIDEFTTLDQGSQTGLNDSEDLVQETSGSGEDIFAGYTLLEVYGGDLSGHREPNAVVDVGYGDREYWAFTNEYAQLVRVVAAQIILQDDYNEPVNSSGRYYPDEAKVPGTESPDYDEGHVIADSLGGVSNAYNITPQESTLNRHGDQAYMEEVIRSAGGCSDFEALITYPDTSTQIPSHYSITYTINGEVIHDEFDNGNPDSSTDLSTATATPATSGDHSEELAQIDTNDNGVVTIKEAQAAGYSMPIKADFWLYSYMIDGDGDGLVGE